MNVARASLASCLSTGSHCHRFFSHPQTRYRLIKLADPVLDTATVIAQAADASEPVMKGLAGTRTVFRVMHHLLGLTHLFWNVIPRLIFSVRLQWQIGRSFKSGEEVPLHPFKSHAECAYNEKAVTAKEKILCLGFLTTRTAKGAISLFSTGVCQPLLFLQTTSKIQLGKRWDAIAGTHSRLALTKHAISLASFGFEMAYQQEAFLREPTPENFPLHAHKLIQIAAGITENSLEILSDISRILQPSVHPAFRIPLSFAIAGLGLYRTWLLTENSASI